MTVIGPHYWEDQMLSEELDRARQKPAPIPTARIEGPEEIARRIVAAAQAECTVNGIGMSSGCIRHIRHHADNGVAGGKLITDIASALATERARREAAERRNEELVRINAANSNRADEHFARAEAAEAQVASLTETVGKLTQEAADLLHDLQTVDGGEAAMLSDLRRAIAERDLARIALARPRGEFAWVIEHGKSPVSQPLYWTAGLPIQEHPPRHWHSDHLEAVRFARKADAEKVVAALLGGVPVRICEHGWHMAAAALSPTEPAKET